MCAAPGTPPRNIRARAASSTTIVVSWDEPEFPNGIIQVSKQFILSFSFIQVSEQFILANEHYPDQVGLSYS